MRPGSALSMPTRFCDSAGIEFTDSTRTRAATTASRQSAVFVLAFCLMHKPSYVECIVPAFLWLKFEFWRLRVVLQSHEIRKEHGEVAFCARSKPGRHSPIGVAELARIHLVERHFSSELAHRQPCNGGFLQVTREQLVS